MVDQESGYLYWYNIRDQSSQWMSEEDQEAYRARAAEAPSKSFYRPKAQQAAAAWTMDADVDEVVDVNDEY